MVLTTQYEEAWGQRDWAKILEIGPELIAQGEIGTPPGTVAYRLEVAAGSQGMRYDAVLWSEIGLKQVQAGSELHARLLVNGMYSRLLYGAPSRALELAREFEAHASAFPRGGQYLHGWVLYYTAQANEDRGDLDQAKAAYVEALDTATNQGNSALAGMIRVDLALVIIEAGLQVSDAEALLAEVDESGLIGRGRLAYAFGNAEVLWARGRYSEALEAVTLARSIAVDEAEALLMEKAQIHLLEARIRHELGDRHTALVLGLEAGRMMTEANYRRGISRCDEFVKSLLRV